MTHRTGSYSPSEGNNPADPWKPGMDEAVHIYVRALFNDDPSELSLLGCLERGGR